MLWLLVVLALGMLLGCLTTLGLAALVGLRDVVAPIVDRDRDTVVFDWADRRPGGRLR